MSRADRINAAQDVSRLNPFSGQNQFDYRKWEGKEATIKLLSVTWESDYKNAVNWHKYGVEGRNEWFDQEHEGELVITTGQKIVTAMQWSASEGKFVGQIRIPAPVDRVRQYNYLVLRDYSSPVSGGGDVEVLDYFYFITAVSAVSSSVTEVFLSVDAWTMFFHEANIVSVNLDRGHWGHKQISSEKFLENPLESPVDLTFPEEELPSVKPKVSHTSLLSLTTSEPRVCIATVASFEEFRIGIQSAPTDTHYWAEPFTADYAGGDSSSDGFRPQLGFYDSFEIGDLEEDDTSAGRGGYTTPAPHVWAPFFLEGKDQHPGDVRVYSCSPREFEMFIKHVREGLPHLLDTIKAFYVLPSDLIDEGEEFPIAESGRGRDLRFRRVFPQPDAKKLSDIEITNDIFGYGENASDFAKIYTSQFAQIKLNDFNGNAAALGVEELAGDLEFYARASSTFPYLKVQAFLNGIGGNKSKTYSIRPIKEMDSIGFDSKWVEYTWDLDIPTFSVYASAKEINNNYSIDRWRTTSKNLRIAAESAMIDADKTHHYAMKNIERAHKDSSLNTETSKAVRDKDISHTARYAIRTEDLSNRVEIEKLGLSYLLEEARSVLDKNMEDRKIDLANEVSTKNNALGRDTSIRTLNDSTTSSRESIRWGGSIDSESTRLSQLTTFNSYQADEIAQIRDWSTQHRVPGGTVRKLQKRNIDYQNIISRMDRDINVLNIDHNYEEARINGRAADIMQSFNRYSANVENSLGIQGSALSMASSATSSVVGGIVGGTLAGMGAGPAGIATGAISGAAVGMVSSASSLITGFQQLETDQDVAQHQFNKTLVQSSLTDSWSRQRDLHLTHSGLLNASFRMAGGYSLKRTLADNRRTLDRKLRDKVYETSREQIRKTDAIEYDVNRELGNTIRDNIHTRFVAARNNHEETGRVSFANIRRRVTLEEGNLQRYDTGQRWVIARSFDVATSIRFAENRLALDQAELNRNYSKNAIQRRFDLNLSVANRTTDESKAKINADRAINLENSDLSADTEITIMDRAREVSIELANRERKDRYTILNNDYRTGMNSLISETNESRHGAPYQYGPQSDENPNVFGQWGLEVSVERISKAAEQEVANAFRKYGYSMPGTLVENPELGQMSNFTYWQCSDAWIVSPRLADSLALIIKDMFLGGVTLWEDPDLVRLTSIGENR